MHVGICVFVQECKRKNKTDRAEAGVSEKAQIKTCEGNKNSSSWKNIYALKDSHCGKTSPFFIKTK